MAQTANDVNSDFDNTDQHVSESETSDQQLLAPKDGSSVRQHPSIWLIVLESAVQVTILALAITGSMHARRRMLAHFVAVLSVPQLVFIVSRLRRQVSSPAPAVLVSDSLSNMDEEITAVANAIPSQDTADQPEDRGGELSFSQSQLISTNIRNAVAAEVDSLRYVIEQIEETAEQRQQARNLAIAETIASLDESLRSLRRTVESRNKVEQSAPFALVSELEIVKSRLKQAEQEKMELEARLRTAEDNFEEAKRHGERARREADGIASRELSLRTELAVASSRLLRLEEVTERLDRAERRNDELEEQLISGTREQEGLRQSAEDAERRVVRIENISRLLREKIQELTGKPLSGFGEGADFRADTKEEGDGQTWQRRLRSRGDLRPDSVVYQELLREERKSHSTKWPNDPLGTQGESRKGDRQNLSQQTKLPDDGGFGVGDSFSDQRTAGSGSDKLLASENSGDTIFSFSRGEFDASAEQTASDEQQDDKDRKALKGSSRAPVDSPDSPNRVLAQQDSSPMDVGEKEDQDKGDQDEEDQTEEDQKEGDQKEEGQRDHTAFSEDQINISPVPPPPSVAQAEEERLGEAEAEVRERADKEAYHSSGFHANESSHTTSASHLQTSEAVDIIPADQRYSDKDKKEDKDSLSEKSNTRTASATKSVDLDLHQVHMEAANEVEDKLVQDEPETYPESVDSVRQDSPYVEESKSQFGTPISSEESVALAEPTDASDQQGASSDRLPEIPGMGRRSTESGIEEGRAIPIQNSASYLGSLSQKEQLKPYEAIHEEPEAQENIHHQSEQAETVRDEFGSTETVELGCERSEPPGNVHQQSQQPEIVRSESEPTETVEDQLRSARSLVKKAKTRGLALVQAKRLFKKASDKLELVLNEVDDRTEVEADLGGCLLAWAKTDIADPLAQDRLSKALTLLASSAERQPENETVLFNMGLGFCLVASTSTRERALDAYEEACAMYERLLRLNDGSRIACFNCGLAYVSLGRLYLGNGDDKSCSGYFERAAGLFQRSLQLKPGDSKAISYLDDCKRQLRELEAAL